MLVRAIFFAHKRRIAHNIIQLVLRHDALPIQRQRVSLYNIRIAFQRQELDFLSDDLLRLFQHLALGYPQRGLRHGDGVAVDLDAVELLDADLDGVVQLPHDEISLVDNFQNFIFQTAQRKIGFRQKIPAARRRVQKEHEIDTIHSFVLSNDAHPNLNLHTPRSYRLRVSLSFATSVFPRLRQIETPINQSVQLCHRN